MCLLSTGRTLAAKGTGGLRTSFTSSLLIYGRIARSASPRCEDSPPKPRNRSGLRFALRSSEDLELEVWVISTRLPVVGPDLHSVARLEDELF